MTVVEVTGKTHELKSWPREFAAVRALDKTFEVRIDDRGYEVGDKLILKEFDPDVDSYTGEEETVVVTYIYRGREGDPVRFTQVQPPIVVLAIQLGE